MTMPIIMVCWLLAAGCRLMNRVLGRQSSVLSRQASLTVLLYLYLFGSNGWSSRDRCTVITVTTVVN